MLQVGEVAHKLGLNSQTLYFYERIGLIPTPQRTETGYRLFSETDIERLTFISRAKALGLSLDEIKELLTLRDGKALTCQAVHEYLLQKVQQLNEQIKGLQRLRDELLPILERCRQSLDNADTPPECDVLEECDNEN
jgi:MerR family transcriptional regulator, Zn(II)-responsive regulator of zntA